MSSKPVKPFLRWAGGKTRSVTFLINNLPPKFSSDKKYFEPFLGAGSLFFSLCPKNAKLSDLNNDLIECYKAIKEKPFLISRYLHQHRKKNSKNYYEEMRIKYNKSQSSYFKAALFIYLNKTCFNGIWRVNKQGKFNVPYGFKNPPALPTKKQLITVSNALSNVKLNCLDYHEAVKDAQEGDFIYLDPPYAPINKTSYFAHYTKERFSKQDHQNVAKTVRELNKKGCYVMISNSNMNFILELYKKDFNINKIELTRFIRADGKRYKINEVVITNY